MNISGINSNYQSVTVANTDKVDGEISHLKSQQSRLSQQLTTSGNVDKKAELKDELSRVEYELRLKDNDTYRRQNTNFSSIVDITA